MVKYLVGNKCDLEFERRITFDDLEDKKNDLGVRGFETSALKKTTIDELFHELIIELSKIKVVPKGTKLSRWNAKQILISQVIMNL